MVGSPCRAVLAPSELNRLGARSGGGEVVARRRGLVLLILQQQELFSLLQGLGLRTWESVGLGVLGVAAWRVSTVGFGVGGLGVREKGFKLSDED